MVNKAKKQIDYLIQNKCESIIEYSLLNIGEKQYIINTKQILKKKLRQLCIYEGVEILEWYLIPDHVHMLVSVPYKISLSQFIVYLKEKRLLMIFNSHANLKYKYPLDAGQ